MNELRQILEDYIKLRNISKGIVPVLLELIELQNKDGKIIVNASLKRDIGSRINVTNGSIDNMITRLVETEILIRVDRGMYVVCSELKSLDIKSNEPIEMLIKYDKAGKIITINGGRKL